MSCARCEVRAVVATPTLAVSYPPSILPPPPVDPEVPFLVYHPEGEPSWLPSGFGGPRLCLRCGAIYCPSIEPSRQTSKGIAQ